MAQLKKFLSRIQLIYRPSQTSVKVVVLVALVLSIGALIALRLSTDKLKAENKDLHDQAAALTATIDELKEDIEQIGSADGAVEFAQDELGYIDPSTVVYEPEN